MRHHPCVIGTEESTIAHVTPPGTPLAEVDVTPELARALLAAQHPDLADLPITPFGSGFDNVMLRLGDELALRLPRREMSVPLVQYELRWLPLLAPRLPLPIPAPVREGVPGEGYPWPWSVVRWIDGEPADVAPPADPVATADVLGRFLSALHEPAPADAPVNPYRGVPLAARADEMHTRLDALATPVAGVVAHDTVRAEVAAAIALPYWDGPPLWLHGDLHPRNILVSEGAISGIIDFGDITSGDPATDLAVVWMLLPSDVHHRFRTAYGPIDDTTWQRARAWALFFAIFLAFVAQRDGDPARAATATAPLARVFDER